MGVSEIYWAPGKALKMWSLDARVIIEWRDIIVQVVNCDKEDVGFALNQESSQRETDDECQKITHCFTGEEGKGEVAYFDFAGSYLGMGHGCTPTRSAQDCQASTMDLSFSGILAARSLSSVRSASIS